MAQQPIELILMRQLASSLAMPVFLVDPAGTLLYFNEPAEAILGRRFDEAGEMPVERWSTVFTPTDELGAPLPPDALPLVVALRSHRPAHSRFWIKGMDQISRCIQVTAFPLIGIGDRFVGAVALFWDVPQP